MDYGFNIALNMYRNLTGDYDTSFSTTEEIYNAIDEAVPSGTPVVISPLSVSIKENGTHIYETELGIDGYNPITVEVDIPTGGSGGEGFDFTELGYTEEESMLMNDIHRGNIEYTKSLEGRIDGKESLGFEFGGDTKLVYAPMGNTDTCKYMYQMFMRCSNLVFIPHYRTGAAGWMEQMFYECKALKYVPELDCSSCVNIQTIMYNCSVLTDFGGFKNLGMQPDLNTTNSFKYCDSLTHDSIMNIINNLYDRNTAGYSVVDLPLGEENLARISDVEKAIATNKGWTLS